MGVRQATKEDPNSYAAFLKVEQESRLLRAECQQVLTQQFSVWQMLKEATPRSGK